ncbi:MAG: hypothetical protein II843_02415 [Alphaproteobacteria bacterium]|nr:hypothetical protein [Alphaproteobacteria bacterium]MBQ9540649.1 hypothetical protein [Alphaproteobacteria bacterium]
MTKKMQIPNHWKEYSNAEALQFINYLIKHNKKYKVTKIGDTIYMGQNIKMYPYDYGHGINGIEINGRDFCWHENNVNKLYGICEERIEKQQKRQDWWNKNKKTVKGVANGVGITTFVIGGSIFIVYAFNIFVENEHQRIRQEVRTEIEKAMAEKQQIADTITYNTAQNTK